MAIALLLLIGLGRTVYPHTAVQAPLPTVTVVAPALTPKLIAKAFERVLKSQKFKAYASNRRIVLTQSRGRLPQTTGEIVTVQLEVGVRVDPADSGYTLTITDETLVADRGGFEQRKPQDMTHNLAVYQRILEQVKGDLEGHGSGTGGDSLPSGGTHADSSRSQP